MRTQIENLSSTDLAKGAVAGMIGGLIGTWVMTQFQKLMSLQAGAEQAQETKYSQDPREPVSPTERVADILSQSLRGRPVSQEHKALAGQLVHYGYGTAMGGAYGVLAEAFPQHVKGVGMRYGAALWLAGDEVALPLLKLAAPPTAYPLSTHALALAAHLVYGLSTHVACRGTRQLLEGELPETLRRPTERMATPREEPARLDYAEFVATGS